jgi:hypothetical protein
MKRAPISDQTLAELLEERLRGARAFQLFCRRLGPHDVVYTSALAFGADDNIVEVKASAMTLRDSLVQLLQNLDLATAPEEP